ncbi:MAG: OmpA family protein [Fluviicola sp.]|nr:OmpA family protein [Fluviicola sp.]
MKTSVLLFFLGIVIASNAQTTNDSIAIHFGYNSDFIPLHERGLIYLMSEDVDPSTIYIRLTGYTDTIGDAISNLALAELRINAVKKTLSPELKNIETVLVGEDLSKRNDNEKRRVDIIIHKIAHIAVIEEEIPSRKIELGIPMQLNIVFLGGQDVILEESFEELNFLITTMQNDSTLNVQLNGHVCCENDLLLSQKRAIRVGKVLVEEGGIDPDRIQTKGFGNTQPLAPDDSEINMHRNRRVEAVFSRE